MDDSCIPEIEVEFREEIAVRVFGIRLILDELMNGEAVGGESGELLAGLYRATHSLKGAANMVGSAEISGLAHLMENELERTSYGAKGVDLEVAALLNGLIDRVEASARRPLPALR